MAGIQRKLLNAAETAVNVALLTGDIELGAVEIKNATTDDRVIVAAGNAALAADLALYVADANVKADTALIAASASVMDDWDETDRAKVNIIAGQAGITAGAGAVAANTPRTTLASDDPAVTALQLIDNAISGAGFNITQFGGAAVPIGAGTEATAVRVTLPTDGTGVVNIAELPTAATLADAASAAPSTTTIGSIALLMNATTVDRQRAVVNAMDSTGTGIAAAGMVAQYDDTSTSTVTENQFASLRITAARNLKVSLGDLISGEDQTNNVIQTAEKPLSVSTYAPDQDTSTAAEASSVTKASAGNLYEVTATNSSGSARYWQMFNSTTVPAESTVPVISIYVAPGGSIHETYPKGKYFSTGMAWCWSSTAATKTIGSTDGIATIDYK